MAKSEFELLYCSSNKSEVGSISGTMDGTFPNISQTIPDFDTLTLASRTAKPYEYG